MTSYGPSAGAQAGPLTPRACADPLAGLHAAFATLLALEHRDRTGQGCAIESVMVETVLSVTAEGVMEFDASGTLLEGDGNRSPHFVPQDLYEGADRDGLEGPVRVALSVENEQQWMALAELIGRRDWARDPAFASVPQRRGRQEEIDAEIRSWTGIRPAAESVDALLARGIPAAVVMPTRLGPTLPPILERDFVQRVPHAIAGEVPTPTHPFRFESLPGRALTRAAPLLGEHNEEILSELLGLSGEKIEALVRDGVIGDRPVGL